MILHVVPCLQFGMISKIVRMGYLLQNFKCAIIQRRDPTAEENYMPEGGRPCKAEIRLYGATDAGLRDVRALTHAWAMPCEKKRHKELSDMVEHKDKDVKEISKMVLDERLDLQMRREHYRHVHKKEYDGGNL